MSQKNNSTEKTLEALIAEFEERLAWFESPEFELEASIRVHKEMAQLLTEIRTRLEGVMQEVEVNFLGNDVA